MKRIVILQPGYLPWLGFFDQLDLADEFVVYDDVQFDRRGWRNRNRVKSPPGPVMLTVPVVQKGRFHMLMYEARVIDDGWRDRHRSTLERCYRRAPFFEPVMARLEPVYGRPWDRLIDLDLELIRRLAELLGIATPLVLASQLGVDGGKSDRLLDICRHLGADRYLTGDAAKGYLDRELFARAGIALEFQEYEHPAYPQLWGEFVPYLSVVDLLMNAGPDSLLALSSRGRRGFEGWAAAGGPPLPDRRLWGRQESR